MASVKKPSKKKSRSGTSRTYAARRDAGRPNRTFSMATDVDELISSLAKTRDVSRSAIVELAVRELAKVPPSGSTT